MANCWLPINPEPEGFCFDEYMRERGGVESFPDARFEADGNAVLEADCDVLIPAALEGQITSRNAARIRAKLIAEAANGPVTYEAAKSCVPPGRSLSRTSISMTAASQSPTSSGSRISHT